MKDTKTSLVNFSHPLDQALPKPLFLEEERRQEYLHHKKSLPEIIKSISKDVRLHSHKPTPMPRLLSPRRTNYRHKQIAADLGLAISGFTYAETKHILKNCHQGGKSTILEAFSRCPYWHKTILGKELISRGLAKKSGKLNFR